MRIPIVLAACLLIGVSQPAGAGEASGHQRYAKVSIDVREQDAVKRILEGGVCLDHYVVKPGGRIEVVVSGEELEVLQSIGVSTVVLAADIAAEVAARPKVTESELLESRAIMERDGILHFGYGSMGGYFTYAEVVQRLDSMRMEYPQLITARESLGVTEQGRVVWGVEISDNPGVPEPDEAVVHYDALHHAREPQSMATIMYYMYWLLDNYGVNPEATYLVNNRRMCFVPVVNADGYVYNQTTNPNGGGGWRKNRRNNGGSYGVDLNRNYSYQWGCDNIGSSPTPSSETYRGPSALSEPEARAITALANRKRPSIAMSAHSVAGRYLNPYGYRDTVVSYEYYAEFASDFSTANNYLYGTVFQMLDYLSNGTTRDYLHHDLSCYTWVPEVGGSGFWPAQAEIVPIAQENLLACRYMSWVAGGFADYQSFQPVGRGWISRNDTLRFSVTLRNKGVSLPAHGVSVSVQSLSSLATPIVSGAAYGSIAPREAATNSVPFAFRIGSSAATMDEIRFAVLVTQEGIETSRDTFSVIVGYPRVLFSEDCESGIGQWTRSGNGVQWDTTFVMAYRGSRSISDSRYGNVANSTNNALAMSSSVSLAGALNPRLEYFARWANEQGYDYVRLQISTNNGSTWTTLAGRYTTIVAGQPGYTSNEGTWVWEHINLAPYAGQEVRIRFALVSDSGLRGDGFYVDDLRLVDYRDSVTTGAGAETIPLAFGLSQNYPNPFNPATTITYRIPDKCFVSLVVCDLLGRNVATLVNREQAPGSYAVTLDAQGLASGMYIYRVKAGPYAASKKLLVMK